MIHSPPPARAVTRPLRGASSKRRGAAAVELAVLAPFLLFLFLITVDFARVFYVQLTLNDCARNGALFAANLRSYQETGWIKPYDNAITPAVAAGQNLNPPLQADQVTVTSGVGSDGNPNVTVTINYPFNAISQFPGLGKAVNLKASASMRVAP